MELLLIIFIIIVGLLIAYKPKKKKSRKYKNYSQQNDKKGYNYELQIIKPDKKSQIESNKDYSQENKQKGHDYELQIGRYYQKQGYKVYFKGINEGLKDQGIDLIAYKDNEALLIQCKNWEYSQVKQEQLRIFLGDCTAYLEQNHKIFAKKNVKRVFITSSKDIDYGVKKFLQTSNIEYKIIPYEKT